MSEYAGIRSGSFRQEAEKLLKQDQESTAVEKYVQGYCIIPESADAALHFVPGIEI